MNYDVDYFINKFEAIPDSDWTVGAYCNLDDGKRCALGHCGERWNCVTTEGQSLSKLIFYAGLSGIVFINDGKHPKFQQATPKERVLAALRLIKSQKRT